MSDRAHKKRQFFFPVLLLITVAFFSAKATAQMRQIHIEPSEDNDINKMSFYSASSGYVGFSDWVGFTTDTGRTYIQKPITLTNVDYNGYSVNLTFGFVINGLQSFNQDTVIVFGHYGLVPSILYSINGGNNFKLVYHSQYNNFQLRTGITDMIFPQQNTVGYAIDADRVLKTTDKGANWAVSLIDEGSYFDYLEAADNNNVFAICRSQASKIRKTNNAGTNWTFMNLPPGTVNYTHFLTSAKGWLNMNNNDGGTLYYTSNSGANWTIKTNNQVQPFLCEKMRFINDSTGIAIKDPYITLLTTDSGKVWQRLLRSNNYTYLGYSHYDLHIRDNNQFWAGGGHGYLELTTNGGAPVPTALFLVDTTNLYLTNTVNLRNYSKPGYQYTWIVNSTTISTSYNSSYLHNIYLGEDTVTLIVSDGVLSDTLRKYPQFIAVPYPAPVVTSYNPVSGGTGTVVTITGDFFANVSAVSFGGIPATSFTVNSINQLTAVVGAGANGNVTVTTATGTGSRPGFITFPPPVITSFSPTHGPAGTTVTITGINFSTVTNDNIVYFGSVKAQVLTATTTQLTVTVPAGATVDPLSVTINRHTAYSSKGFTITFPAACRFSEFTFDRAKNFGLGTTASESLYGNMVISDMDNDGKNDIVSINWFGFSVLRNTSTSGFVNFAPALEVISNNNPLAWHVATADMDGDGTLDVAVTNNNANTVSVFKNNSTAGSLVFSPKTDYPTSLNPTNITFNDFDGDGKPDMVVTNSGPNVNTISIYRNKSINGVIAFEQKIDIVSGLYNGRVCTGDLDGDGKADLVILDGGIFNSGLYTFTVYRNASSIGSIAFAARQVFNHYTISQSEAALFDADNDGKLDVCIGYDVRFTPGAPGSTGIYRNISTPGNIALAAPFGLPSCGYNRTISYGDLDGDSKLDLFSSCWASGSTALFNNLSTSGNFSFTSANAPFILITGARPATAIADIDGDSKPELITGGSPNVYRNMLNERGALAGKDTTICSGQSVVLGGFAAFNHTYSWTSSAGGFTASTPNPVVSPAATITYYVAVTNPAGCTSLDTIQVTVAGPAPVANAGPNNVICQGSSLQIGTAASGSNTYSWSSFPVGFSSAVANPVVSPAVFTSYFLTVNSGSCVAKDTIDINVFSLPAANAGPDQNICSGGSAVIGTTGSSFNTYSWTSSPAGFSSSNQTPVVSPLVTTSYFLEVTNTGNCVKKDTVIITVSPAPAAPVLSASGPLAICEGNSLTITSSIASNTLQWFRNNNLISAAGGQQNYIATEAGSYQVRYITGGCFTGFSNSIVVTVNPVPPTPVITLNGNLLQSSAASGNQWYLNSSAIPGANNATLVPPVSGLYTVMVTVNGCSSTISAAFNHVITAVNSPQLDRQIVVSPNPATDHILIRYTGNSGVFSFSVSDLSGKTIFDKGTFSRSYLLNSEKLSSGYYVIKIINNKTKEQVQRLVLKL